MKSSRISILTALCLASCASDAGQGVSEQTTSRAQQTESATPSADTSSPSQTAPSSTGATAAPSADGATASAALSGTCPAGFEPKAGVNEFSIGGKTRRFHVLPAKSGAGPRPLFVALTGTVQEELSFAAQSGLDKLVEQGWTVVAPVRSCSQEQRNCNQLGTDGRVWEPWYDGTTPLTDDAGPDVAFVDAMVHCVASKFPIAKDAIYAGGISAGGTFTNRNLTFNSALFAGGVPASGNWTYGAPPKTPKTMDGSIMIVIWGGPNDKWGQSPPYDAETKATSEYYAKQPNVVTVSCSGTHGHMWPAAYTAWIAETLLSHKKGSDPKSFVLKQPPAGLSCVLGPYTDH